jgi:WD40 repeat protein
MTFNVAGDVLAVGTGGGAIYFIDPKGGKVLNQLTEPMKRQVLALAYTVDGKVLHAAYTGATIARWDTTTGRAETMKLARQANGCAAAFSPDRRYLAVGDTDGFVWLWNTTTGIRAQAFDPRYNQRLEVVAFSPDGKWLASADFGFVNTFDGATNSHSTSLRIRPVRPDDVPK